MAGSAPPTPEPHPRRIPPIAIAAALVLGRPAAPQETAAAPPDGEATHIGTHRRTLTELEGPIACAFGPNGDLYVAERDGDRVRHYPADGGAASTLGLGHLVAPAGLAAGQDGCVFVSDGGGSGIVLLRPNAEAQTFGASHLRQPRGLALGPDQLAVADAGQGCVALFDLEGKYLSTLGSEHLERPLDVAFRPGGALAVLDGDSVVLLAEDGTLEGRFGAWGAFPGLLSSPGGLAAHGDRLFVCDTENHRVQVFGPGGELKYAWGLHAIRPREGKGKLHYPAHVALSADGNRAALPEPLDGRVQIFERAPGAEPEVDPLRALGGKPSAHYGLDWEVSGNHLAAVEPESRRVLIYDLRLVPGDNPVQITELGGYGTSLGLFLRPTGLWFDGPGRRLVVCDGDQATLTEVTFDLAPDAELAWDPFLPRMVRSIDLRALTGGPLPRPLPITPRDVAQHPDGRLFVLCERNAEVLVLAPDLTPLAVIDGSPELLQGPVQLRLTPDGNSLLVVDELAGQVRRFGVSSSPLGEPLERLDAGGELHRPFGLALGPENSLYVGDAATSRVHVRSADGDWSSFGGPGIRRDELLHPRALGFDQRGRLFVLDHGNHRGMVLDPGGDFLSAFGPRLYTKPARLPHTYDPEDYVE